MAFCSSRNKLVPVFEQFVLQVSLLLDIKYCHLLLFLAGVYKYEFSSVSQPKTSGSYRIHLLIRLYISSPCYQNADCKLVVTSHFFVGHICVYEILRTLNSLSFLQTNLVLSCQEWSLYNALPSMCHCRREGHILGTMCQFLLSLVCCCKDCLALSLCGGCYVPSLFCKGTYGKGSLFCH